MIVVDANVIAYLLLPGDFVSYAESLLCNDPEWHVPVLWRSEIRSVLGAWMRNRDLSRQKAVRLFETAERIVQGREHIVSAAEVLRLMDSTDCSAYDCEYAALAGQLSVPLVTCDKQLLRAFPAFAVSLLDSHVKP